MPSSNRIFVSGLTKSYSSGNTLLQVLDGLDLHVEAGQFVSILGPSGCGKSTLFSLLTGVERPSSGEISVDGKSPTDRRETRVAWMPQSDALLPWRTVEQNVALGLEVSGVRRKVAITTARELLNTFGLAEFALHRPFQLSGGMRQRAALARTVATGRDILLLDEPFGALDALTRTQLQLWLEKIWERNRWTVLLITHDVREAVLLSDRVVVLSPRPSKIRLELEVPIPRPRTISMLADARAMQIEQRLLEALEVGIG